MSRSNKKSLTLARIREIIDDECIKYLAHVNEDYVRRSARSMLNSLTEKRVFALLGIEERNGRWNINSNNVAARQMLKRLSSTKASEAVLQELESIFNDTSFNLNIRSRVKAGLEDLLIRKVEAKLESAIEERAKLAVAEFIDKEFNGIDADFIESIFPDIADTIEKVKEKREESARLRFERAVQVSSLFNEN